MSRMYVFAYKKCEECGARYPDPVGVDLVCPHCNVERHLTPLGVMTNEG